MPETRRKFDPEFREGAVRIVRETGKPIAQVARDLGINAGTLANWCARERAEHEGTEGLSTGHRRVHRSVCPQRWRSGPTSRIQPTRSAVRRLPGGVRR